MSIKIILFNVSLVVARVSALCRLLYVQLNRRLTGLVSVVLLSYMLIPMLPAALDLINPLNESRPKSPLYMVELYIDQDKYFYSILIHAYITSLAGIIPLFATDSLFSSCTHHACGMIKILGWAYLCVIAIEKLCKIIYSNYSI